LVGELLLNELKEELNQISRAVHVLNGATRRRPGC